MSESRRRLLSLLARAPLAVGLAPKQAAHNKGTDTSVMNPEHHDVVVIGSGFGGTMTALTIARRFKKRDRGERVLILERGAWWTTPVETVQDKETATRTFLEQAATKDFLQKEKKQPVRVWVSAGHLRGLFDLATRCVKRKGQPDGLYDLTIFKRPDHAKADQDPRLTVIRANGVGGGSLIYQNVTIEPPDDVFSDWPVKWNVAVGSAMPSSKRDWFKLGREAIGKGALFALDNLDPAGNPNPQPTRPVNAGLSNIVTRSVGLDAHFAPGSASKRLDTRLLADNANARLNRLWLDRPRVFQKAAEQLEADDYGAVDLSINDVSQASAPDGKPNAVNHCERQGRCILGCLPGARHTLNKQLMQAIFGTPPIEGPAGPAHINVPAQGRVFLDLRALAEVTDVRERFADQGGGYLITYTQRDPNDTSRAATFRLTADHLILAAGTIGTSHLLLKCKRAGLPELSDKVGHHFSNNGDYLGFVEGTRETIGLFRGPMATSFAHFGRGADFHTLEDAGLPRALAILFGGKGKNTGSDFVKGVAKGGFTPGLVTSVLMSQFFKDLGHLIKDALRAVTGWGSVPPEDFDAEEIEARNVIGIAAIGRDAANGILSVGGPDEDAPRLMRADGKPYNQDPIYEKIIATIKRFATEVRGDRQAVHGTPYGVIRNDKLDPATVLGSLHPIGGCRMASSAKAGVVDEFGRVYRKGSGFYKNLYVADGATMHSSLGVNPSLTITALALRTACKLVDEHYPL